MTDSYRDDDPFEPIGDDIRREAATLDPEIETAALDRVWSELERASAGRTQDHRVLTCDDIQGLLPAFLAGDLKPERALLVEDHTRSCVPCRRQLRRLEKGESTVAAPPMPAPAPGRSWTWALAAGLVLALGVAPFLWTGGFFGADGTLTLVEGTLLAPAGDTVASLETGAEIAYGREVLTPRGSTATVELADGSRVELRERSRLTAERGRDGTTLRLAGGNIIVEAAQQKDGHLYVATDDCLVSVKGTVFSVNSGTRGSRVAVYEGEVWVDERGNEHVLEPGDQVTTSDRLSRVSLAEEIAWSPNAERHLALLSELVSINEELRSVTRPGLRYGSALLDALPADTVVYLAMPNLSGSIQETLAVLEERFQTSALLSEWWQSTSDLQELRESLGRVVALGDHLGDELVVAGWQRDGEFVGPAFVAESGASAEFRAALEAEMVATGDDGDLMFVDDPWGALPAEGHLLVWIAPEGIVAAPSADALRQLADALSGEGPTFAGTTLHASIAGRYQRGVEFLAAVDLQAMVSLEHDAEDQADIHRLGIDGVEDLIIEQWVENERTRRQAVLSFADARRGIAGWLDAPAPMESLTFFSPESTTVAALLVKDPATLVADLLAAMTAQERAEIETHLDEVAAEHGWDPREDLLPVIGGELAFGIDGPVVPTLAWKVAVEIYDPSRLQFTLERLVTEISDRLVAEGEGSLELTAAPSGDRWTIRGAHVDGVEREAHYAFVDGYLVATPSAALLDRALRHHSAELTLLDSDQLQSVLPADGQVNFSALWYQDFSAVIEPLTSLLGGANLGEELSPELQQGLAGLGETIGPSVMYAYGEEDAIVLSANSTHNPLGIVQLLALRELLPIN